jgi:UDP-N-acetyl-D-mannosaminuronic acid dehydrogenase
VTRVAIVGLGYVGLTLAVALARSGLTVFGQDRQARVVEALAGGRSHLYEPGVDDGLQSLLGDRLHLGQDLAPAPMDAAVICVSTPVSAEGREPELESLRDAARAVAERYTPDTLVVVRSTVPVGATRGVVLPELAARWPRVRLAFCPERTIQGQALRELGELPQVVGAIDEPSAGLAAALFARLTPRVVRVSSLEAAEAVKLVNNCHTDLIYSYGNEVALLAERLGLDPLEIIRAANVDYPRPDLAKPGYVGGGCLSKDPYILLASARSAGHEPWLVGQARALNEHLPGHVARRFVELLAETRGGLEGARVGLLGFAYKGWPPTDDMRGAPVVPMLDVLRRAPLSLAGHDFLVAPAAIAALGVTPCSPEEAFAGSDGVLVITDHPEYAKLDLPRLLRSLRRPALVYDSWRILDGPDIRDDAGVRYAGIGYARPWPAS